MLGRGMDEIAVLARQREGDLAFEIEMLLSADAELGMSLCGAVFSAASGSPRTRVGGAWT